MASVVKLKDLVDALASQCAESPDGSFDGCVSELERFFGDIDGNRLLKKALESPVIPVGEKIAVLDELCRSHGFSVIARNFLAMVAEFGKLRELSVRRRSVTDRLRSAGGAVKATVTVARPVSGADEERIREAVARLAGGAESEVQFVEDSDIIGGIVVRIGNSIYDDSVRTHLDGMRSMLSK